MSFISKKERRRHLRVKPEKNYPIIIDINGEDFLDIVFASDISQSGVGIVVPHMFEGCKINGDVSIVVTLPSPFKRSILLSGKIRHVAEKKFGVSFLNIGREDRKQIRRYISHQIKNRSFFTRLMFRLRLI